VVVLNDQREPREAAAPDSGMRSDGNGCLPLAPRSGSPSSRSSLNLVVAHLLQVERPAPLAVPRA
jgi:hypothetical protein